MLRDAVDAFAFEQKGGPHVLSEANFGEMLISPGGVSSSIGVQIRASYIEVAALIHPWVHELP